MKKMTLLLALALLLPSLATAQRKRALLIGISNYRAAGLSAWTNIHGADDVALLAPTLRKNGFRVNTVIDGQATWQAITRALETLCRNTRRGDVVLILFAGHGQPVEDGLLPGYPKGDERDGWDESFVAVDAERVYGVNGYKGEHHLTDDQLNGYVKTLRTRIGPRGALYVVVDACHAGEMSRRGLETVRGTNEGLTADTANIYRPPRDNIRHYAIERGTRLAPVLFLEACKSYERNTEVRTGGKEYGALSYHLWLALQSMPTLGRDASVLKNAVQQAAKKSRRWPRTQTLVTETSF